MDDRAGDKVKVLGKKKNVYKNQTQNNSRIAEPEPGTANMLTDETTDLTTTTSAETQNTGNRKPEQAGFQPEDTSSEKWTLFGQKHRQSKVVYFTQVVILYVIVLTALVNISIGSKDFNLWNTLLSTSIGLILPAPKLKREK